MSDMFKKRSIGPMLLYQQDPFNDPDYIYELKLDGIRCIAYIDKNSVILENKRFKDVSNLYPELMKMNKCIKDRCILDGEIICLENGKPNFFLIQARSLMGNDLKIKLASENNPVQFVAYDILYCKDKELVNYPLMKRKEILSKNITEGYNLSISRFIEEKGIEFFNLAKEQELEGVVAKKKEGLYHIGKRTHDWVKFKVLQEEDLIVCGYMPDEDNQVKDLVLGYFDEKGVLQCRGKVFMGFSNRDKNKIIEFAKTNTIQKAWFKDYNNIVWLKLKLVGTVQYMQETKSGGMRQPVWRGLRDDKDVGDCTGNS